MSETGQQKTERATPRREREARRQGQVARSRELTTAVLVAGGAMLLIGQGGAMAERAAVLVRGALSFRPEDLSGTTHLAAYAGGMLRAGLGIVVPILAFGFVVALAGPLLLGGWNFSTQALMPQLSRLSPLAGFGRLFSGRTLADLGLGILKIAVLAGIAATVFAASKAEVLSLSTLDVNAGVARGGAAVLRLFGWLSLGLAAIALVDVPFQLFRHRRQLRMTKQEVREEHKQSEGRPEVRAKIRQAQHALSRRRMMAAVPKADVVVVNPTHYAVALQYSAGRMRAPRVVAKGADLVAAAIRDLAREHRVPIVSAPPLARALFRSTELDHEIPADLFHAVAQVLTYVYQLKNRRPGAAAPTAPEIGDVPGGEADPPSA